MKTIETLIIKYRSKILSELADMQVASMGEEGLIVVRIEAYNEILKDLNALVE